MSLLRRSWPLVLGVLIVAIVFVLEPGLIVPIGPCLVIVPAGVVACQGRSAFLLSAVGAVVGAGLGLFLGMCFAGPASDLIFGPVSNCN